MKILKYILIAIGVFLGAGFAVAETTEPYLNENMQAAYRIPDAGLLIQFLVIYAFIGVVSGFVVWFSIFRMYFWITNHRRDNITIN